LTTSEENRRCCEWIPLTCGTASGRRNDELDKMREREREYKDENKNVQGKSNEEQKGK